MSLSITTIGRLPTMLAGCTSILTHTIPCVQKGTPAKELLSAILEESAPPLSRTTTISSYSSAFIPWQPPTTPARGTEPVLNLLRTVSSLSPSSAHSAHQSMPFHCERTSPVHYERTSPYERNPPSRRRSAKVLPFTRFQRVISRNSKQPNCSGGLELDFSKPAPEGYDYVPLEHQFSVVRNNKTQRTTSTTTNIPP